MRRGSCRRTRPILFQIGGALNEIDDGHSPVGNRDAPYVLNISGPVGAGGRRRSEYPLGTRCFRHDMRSFSTGGTYINFLTEDEGPERTEDALGKGLRRLPPEVKARWDPQNVFRTNRNILPVAG